jgi:transposase
LGVRLEAEGKEFKVVITACMRKLLVILNSMVKSNSQWNPSCLCEPLDAKHSRFAVGD